MTKMKKSLKCRLIFIPIILLYILAFCIFYLKYVPLIDSLQIVLIPILSLTLVITVINKELGILFFVFTCPLINNIPYFFGIEQSTPHAPTALVLFLVFFLGWVVNNLISFSEISFNHAVFKPLIFFSIITLISGIITFLRYANFYPILSDNIYELVVNVNYVTAGGAIMSTIFNCLNYLTGLSFFVILANTLKSKIFIKKLLIVISVSALGALLFSIVQKYYSISLGNTSFWTNLNRINSTFKDPNSFGIFLSAFLPLTLGMFISFRNKLKLLFLIIIILSLFIFPSVGSRSGLLGLTISLGAFFSLFLASKKITGKKKFIYGISFSLVCVVIFILFLIFFSKSNLMIRINKSIDVLSERETVSRLFTRKLDFWRAAFLMVRDYPLTGVGVGAFIIELPNYLTTMELPFRETDSAENYFFQVGSELGFIGIFFISWFFLEFFRFIRKGWKKFFYDDKDKFILIGAISSLVSFFVNFLFHSYIGSFEIKYFFWILVALTFISLRRQGKTNTADVRFNPKFRLIIIIFSLFFAVVHLWNSTQSLSIKSRSDKFEWDQNYGFYELEKNYKGSYFRWTKKSAGIAIENVGHVLVVPMIASHPDISKDPVKVEVYFANHYFKKRKLIKTILLKDNRWIDFKYQMPKMPEKKIYLVFETSRLWQPLKYSGSPDLRKLGIGLGNVWFKYPNKVPANMIRNVQRISHKNWEGESKDKLWSNGISKIFFEVKQKNTAFILHIKGQKAFNIGPYIIIKIDNRIIGKTVLNKEEWTTLVFTPEISKGRHSLSVEYTNDIHEPKLKQDRNVHLGDLEIINIRED